MGLEHELSGDRISAISVIQCILTGTKKGDGNGLSMGKSFKTRAEDLQVEAIWAGHAAPPTES